MIRITTVRPVPGDLPEGILHIPTGRIIPSGRGVKTPGAAELAGLAERIRRNGISPPLTVTETGKNGVYELVSGEETLRAAKMLGLSTVPCRVIGSDEAEPYSRKTSSGPVPDEADIFDQAEAFRNIAEIYGLTQEELAERFSVSQSYIANKLRMLRFSPEERELIRGNGLTERHARALLRIADAEKRLNILKEVVEKRMSVARTEDYVGSLVLPSCGEAPQKKEKVVLHDLRGFYNSIDNAVDILMRAGLTVSEERKVTEDSVSVTVTVRRKERRVE